MSNLTKWREHLEEMTPEDVASADTILLLGDVLDALGPRETDDALNTALTHLESTDEPISPMSALIAAVVLIGRRFVPAKEPVVDATMPGKRSTRTATPAERAMAGVLLSGADRADATSQGESGPRTSAEWREAVEQLSHKDRDELAQALSALEVAKIKNQALRDMLAARNRTLEEQAQEIAKLTQTPADAAAVHAHLLENLDRVSREGADAKRKAAHSERAHAALRRALTRVLGLADVATDDTIVSKVCEAVNLLTDANDAVTKAQRRQASEKEGMRRESARCMDMIEHVKAWASSPRVAMDQFDHALVAAFEDWQRTGGRDDAETDDEWRAKWQRIQPLIKALHTWDRQPREPEVDAALSSAFYAWQEAEAAALDADEAPLPRQPDDPGVADLETRLRSYVDADDDSEDRAEIRALMVAAADEIARRRLDDPSVRVSNERLDAVAYLRREAARAGSPRLRGLADAIARGDHTQHAEPA